MIKLFKKNIISLKNKLILIIKKGNNKDELILVIRTEDENKNIMKEILKKVKIVKNFD